MVTLEVAKQGAIYHGLATLLSQPSPVMQRRKHRREVGCVSCGRRPVAGLLAASHRPSALGAGPVLPSSVPF